ncbi:MAG: hypothetical protein AAF901_04660 [Bacteroidota bacterium]
MTTIEYLANFATALGIPIALFAGILSMNKTKKDRIRSARLDYEEEYRNYSKLRKDFLLKKTDIKEYQLNDFQDFMYEMVTIFTSLKKLLDLKKIGKVKNFNHLQLLLGDINYLNLLLKKFRILGVLGFKQHFEILLPKLLTILEPESIEFKEVDKFYTKYHKLIESIESAEDLDQDFLNDYTSFFTKWTNQGIDNKDNSPVAVYYREGDWQAKQYSVEQLSSTYNILKVEGNDLVKIIIPMHLKSAQMEAFRKNLNLK